MQGKKRKSNWMNSVENASPFKQLLGDEELKILVRLANSYCMRWAAV